MLNATVLTDRFDRGPSRLKIPLISDEAINIGKSWLFEEELTELFHERPQAILPHGRDELIMQVALAEQRMDTCLVVLAFRCLSKPSASPAAPSRVRRAVARALMSHRRSRRSGELMRLSPMPRPKRGSLVSRKEDCRVRNWRGAGPCGWARLQFLPIRTTREVFPQAAHPTRFCGRVMCRLGHGGHFHAYVAAAGKGWIFQSQYSPSMP